MRLKILTTTFLCFGVILLLAWPFILGAKPGKSESKKVKVEWGRRVLVYFGVTTTAWLITAMSAYLVIRKSRTELAEMTTQNLRSLVEGSLQDHDRKS